MCRQYNKVDSLQFGQQTEADFHFESVTHSFMVLGKALVLKSMYKMERMVIPFPV